MNSYKPGKDWNEFGSKYLIMFDPGHGGLINGEYQTQGKRSPVWEDGSQLFEGVSNRNFVESLIKQCNFLGIDCVNLVPENEDISLDTRCERANEIWERDQRGFLCSIHSNAGGGTGYEIYTYPGYSQSDEIATVFYEQFLNELSEIDGRHDYSDEDPDKEAEFYVLAHTKCPAVLHEILFMDNKEDCKQWLMDDKARTRLVDAIISGILKLNGKHQ